MSLCNNLNRYSSCGDRITTGFYCEGMFGLGLNLAQCSLNSNATACGDPVYVQPLHHGLCQV